jgi:hypothetical protein
LGEKMPDGYPTLPLFQSLRLRKNSCILFVPFLHCHAHLWGKRGGGGKFAGEGRGVNWKCEMMMMGDDGDE